MNKYKAFYRGKQTEVSAKTSLQAQLRAADHFKAKKSYEVTVVLCERADGSTVIHSAGEF